jgi:pilus assembly protein CpaE
VSEVVDFERTAGSRVVDRSHTTIQAVVNARADMSGVAGSKIRVAIVIHDLAFHQEVLDYLGRQPRLEIIFSSTDTGDLGSRKRGWDHESVDAVVICPVAGRTLAGRSERDTTPAFLVAEEMTVPILRTAIDVGALGAFCWPEERADLAQAMAASHRHAIASSHVRGRVIAVLGARGGVGVTFVASHLAAALANSGHSAALEDMDPAFGDLTPALGLVEDDGLAGIEALVPVIDELGPDHIAQALTRHDAGFDVLLSRSAVPRAPAGAPEAIGDAPLIPTGLYGACVALLAHSHDAVVLHVPRTLGALAKAAVHLADETILVIGPDLMSLYGARRTLSALSAEVESTNLQLVLNVTRRPEASAAEVERVLGLKPVARIRPDPSVITAQAAGRVLGPRGGRAWRDVSALARRLSPQAATEGTP